VIQAKDEELQWKLKAKDDTIQAKDDTIRAKDDTIRAKDGELHRTLKDKDDLIRAKDAVIRSNEKILELVHIRLGETTATLWEIEGKLNLRCAIEEFEKRASLSEKKDATNRFKKWSAMLQANTGNIAHFLLEEDRPMTDAEVDRWARAAQELYQALSTMVHTSRDMQIVINAARLNPDPLKLAICMAKATPIPYQVVNEPDKKDTGGEKGIVDGGSSDVDVAAVAMEIER